MSSINNLDKKYQDLISDILNNGIEKKDRTGTGTLSVFGRQFRHNMSDGFPLLTTKKMAIKSIITELKWFLKGDTNIKYLLENDCHIWTGDAKKWYDESFKKYWGEIEGRESKFKPISTKEFEKRILKNDEFAREWGELGPIYGVQWKKWKVNNSFVDQIGTLIKNIKNTPDSRRLMVNAWNVGEIYKMTLPPCHYGFQVYTKELNFYELRDNLRSSREGWFTETAVTLQDLQAESIKRGLPIRTISLMWNQRSVDTFLGLPFNIASYGMLLELLAIEVNMIPEELIGNLGDTHLYLNHLEQATEQINREPMPHLPKLKLGKVDILNGEFEYEILHYQYHPNIKAPLSN